MDPRVGQHPRCAQPEPRAQLQSQVAEIRDRCHAGPRSVFGYHSIAQGPPVGM